MGEVYSIYDGDDEVDRFEVRDLRVKTRFAIDNEFYDEFTPILGTTISMVYVALVRHANKDQKTWPSQSRIARQLGVNRQWVGVCLQILQMFHLIKSVRLGKMCTNRYYLIDQKSWRRDYEKMLKEVEKAISTYEKKGKGGGGKVMSTQLTSPSVDIRCLRRCHGLLSKLTSNRKDKQKDKQERTKIVSVKKTSSRKATNDNQPQERYVGKGKNVETLFDEKTNTIIHRRY